MNEVKKDFKKKVLLSFLFVTTFIAVASIITASNVFAQETAANSGTTVKAEPVAGNASALPYGLIAASIAFGFGAIGAGIAIGNVGAAAMGAISEKPEIAGQALIFIALAEGLVVFGFITALMILGKV